MLLNRAQEGLDLEAVQQDEGGTPVQAAVEDDLQPVDVEEGEDRDHDVARAQGQAGLALGQVRDEVARCLLGQRA